MKVAYLNLRNGISSSAILGALVDTGVGVDYLKKALRLAGLKGIRFNIVRNGKNGSMLRTILKAGGSEISFRGIKRLLRSGRLNDSTLKKIGDMYASIERDKRSLKIKKTYDICRFAEIVAISACFELLGLKRVYFSDIFIPGPFRAEGKERLTERRLVFRIIKGVQVSVEDGSGAHLTPEVAALLKVYGHYRNNVLFKPDISGYGRFEERDGNEKMLEIILGEEHGSYDSDSVIVIETAIDDTPPIVYTYVCRRLFEMGALDVYLTNVYMKKGRPGQLITVIINEKLLNDASELLFRETQTSGLRYYRADRMKLYRKSRYINSRFGKVSVKIIGEKNDVYHRAPEYESCEKIARKRKVPFMKVYTECKRMALIIALFLALDTCRAFCDTVNLRTGGQIKGIVIEEYMDSILISTPKGEKEIKKEIIKSIEYDLLEQNLVAMGDKDMKRGNYERAYYYYEKAKKVNPDYKDAVNGSSYLSGYLYRRQFAKKAEQVQQHQFIEDYSKGMYVEEKEDDMEKLKRLVGMDIKAKKGMYIVVEKIYAATPAMEAGIIKGDYIASIWGRLTKYLSPTDVAKEILKPGHMEVKMAIDRNIACEKGVLRPEHLSLEFEGIKLMNIKQKSRAYAAGLRDGDMLLEVDSRSVRYTPLKDVIKTLGKKDGKILIRREITIWRTKRG